MTIESTTRQNIIYSRLNAIQKKLKSPKENKNTFGNYNYRSAEDILVALKDILQENEYILLNNEVICIQNRFYVQAEASFCVGSDKITVRAQAREDEQKKGMDGSQITGSATSYARKYALAGLFAIDNEKDSDSTDNTSEKPIVKTEFKKPAQENISEQVTQLESTENIKLNFEEYKELLLNSKNLTELKNLHDKISKHQKSFSKEELDELCKIKDNLKTELTSHESN
jgi:hypothetical protein